MARADTTASFTKPTVGVGQSVALIITSDTPIQSEPKTESIQKNFKITGRQTQSTSTIVNGKSNASYQLIYTLYPLTSGKITVSDLVVNGQKLLPATIEVLDKAPQEEGFSIRMNANVEDKKLYEGSGFLYTVQLGPINDILDGGIEPPFLENADIQQIGTDTKRTISNAGGNYPVLERHYMIIPKKSGEQMIRPAAFSGLIKGKNVQPQRWDSLFHQGLLLDHFIGAGAHEDIFVQAKPITVEIFPKPTDWSGWWLPSENVKVTYEDEFSPDVQAGDTLERRVVVTAENISADRLPLPQQPETSGLNVYPSQETRDTYVEGQKIIGRITQSFIMVPAYGGELTIPGIEIPWFNTVTQEKSIARIPERKIMVTGPKKPEHLLNSMKHQELKTTDQNVKIQPEPPIHIVEQEGMWVWLLVGLLGGGLIVGLVSVILGKVKRHRRKKPLPDLYPF